jgi:uncharacterized protein (TIGR02453 family)
MMTATYNLRAGLDFLSDLSKNNNRAWFDQHRARNEAARQAFESLVGDLIDEFRASDGLRGLSAKECLFRINRDIRFSKDKSPYKTNLAATIAPGGRKSTRLGYHVWIGPGGNSGVAGGLYMPSAAQLNRFRKAIDRDASEFKKLTRARAFVAQFGMIEGERLKTSPKGYDQDHPEIDLLRLKQVTVVWNFPDKAVVARDYPEQVIKACRAMRPFLDYLNSTAA